MPAAMDSSLASEASTSSLPIGYADPDAYLVEHKFHLTHHFTPSFAAELPDAPARHRVSYALVGAERTETGTAPPTLVFMNGMGGHRLSAAVFDGFLADRGVRLLTLDRPSCGASTPVPWNYRVKWAIEAMLSLLELHSITSFTLWSHSNGLLYALPFLLSLPPTIKCTRWCATSPYVPPWLSSSIPLRAARYIPAKATSKLGSLASGAMSLVGPLAASFQWSSSISSPSAIAYHSSALFSLPSAPAASPTNPSHPKPHPLSPEAEYSKFVARTALLPVEKRQFGKAYYSSKAFEIAQKFILAEGLDALGEEANLCLKRDCSWGWPSEEGVPEGDLYDVNFALLAKSETRTVKLQVWYGSDDGLIPTKGQEYLRALCGRLGLLDESAEGAGWVERKGMGHDEILGYETVVGGLAKAAKGKGGKTIAA